MKNKYFMMAEEDGALDILIYGDITSWEWSESDVSSYNLAQLINKSNASRINVRLNSYGGEVAEGLAIYNSLKNHKAEVTTICDGFACSAASIIFMAGDIRVMNSASLLMVHNAWNYARGNAAELRKAADDLEKISTAASEAYRRVMSITEEELQKMLDNETWILPCEALAYGFATVIEGETASTYPQQSMKRKVFEHLQGLKVAQGSGAKEPVSGFEKLFQNFKK